MASGYVILPLETSSGGGSGTPGGSDGQVQFNDGGSFGGDSQFTWDSIENSINLNGLAIRALSGEVSLINDQASPITVFSYDANSFNYSIIEFSISRGTERQVGRLLVANTATTAGINRDSLTMTGVGTGVDFSVTVLSGQVNIQYTSTDTGFNSAMKYTIRQWI